MGCRSGVEVSKQGVEAAVCLGFASRKDVEARRPRLSKSMSKGCRSAPTSTHRREPTGRPTSAKSGGGFVPKPPRLLADYRLVGRNQVASRSAASYPGLEIIRQVRHGAGGRAGRAAEGAGAERQAGELPLPIELTICSPPDISPRTRAWSSYLSASQLINRRRESLSSEKPRLGMSHLCYCLPLGHSQGRATCLSILVASPLPTNTFVPRISVPTANGVSHI